MPLRVPIKKKKGFSISEFLVRLKNECLNDSNQCFLNVAMYMNYLGILLQSRFPFSKSRVGPEILNI